jgi:hypothetical protein
MMKNLIVAFICSSFLVGCASTQANQHYSDIAGSQPFGYFFTGQSDIRTFDTIEEAQDFVCAGQIKLQRASGKQSAKGLGARLIGEPQNADKPVVVVHFLNATTQNSFIDLGKSKDDLEQTLRNAISVGSVYLVFYGDRAASISDFYLQSNYHYTSNSQVQGFTVNDKNYKADYPFGWGNDSVFGYLKKEID